MKNSKIDIENKIQNLEDEILSLKRQLQPNALAKNIDDSQLFSINHIRTYLQILALILTIFLAGFGIIGWLSFSSMSDIRKIHKEIENVSIDVDDEIKKVKQSTTEIQNDILRSIGHRFIVGIHKFTLGEGVDLAK